VVNYKKPLNRRELKIMEQQPASGRKQNIIRTRVPFVRALALADVVFSGLVLILFWSSYKEIEAYFIKMSLKAKIFYPAVIVIGVELD